MIVLHTLYCLISYLVSLQLTLPAGGSFSRSRQHRLLRERPWSWLSLRYSDTDVCSTLWDDAGVKKRHRMLFAIIAGTRVIYYYWLRFRDRRIVQGMVQFSVQSVQSVAFRQQPCEFLR